MIKQLFTVLSLLAASNKLAEEISLPLRPQEPKGAFRIHLKEKITKL